MSKKVLVVDDDKNIIELLRVNLVNAGYAVVAAYDGLQAVSAAHKQKPDLVVLDILLPAGGGETVLERIKLSNDTSMIPVIAISALPVDQVKKKLKGQKVAEIFTKPLDIEALVKKAQEQLGSS